MSSGLSVIICTKNRLTDLGITLRSIFKQRLLPDTLVVVDDGDTEATRALLKTCDSYRAVRVVHIHPDSQSSGLPAARNRGIKALPDLTGIVLFLDDDVTLEESYLETIQDLFQKNPDLCGATGYVRNSYHELSIPVKLLLLVTSCIIPALIPVSLFAPRVTRTAQALYPLFWKPRADTVPAQWLSGCNMAYRSTVFLEGFRFDEHLIRYAQGEDVLFSHSLFRDGKKLVLSYNAHITHRISADSRISPFGKTAMVFGYRNYEISQFAHSRLSGSFFYTVFVIQYIISTVILSLRDRRGLAPIKDVIRAYGMTREFQEEIKSGQVERFNDFLSTLP